MPKSSVVRALVCAVIVALCAAPAAHADPYAEETGPPQAAGAMLVIHGGGWVWTGPWVVYGTRPWARRFDDRYLTWNVDYRRGGEAALDDVTAFYDRLRAQVGPDTPICATGTSAGGHLALMLATRRDLACMISEDGPLDLTHPTTALGSYVQQAFGSDAERLRANSPTLRVGDIHGSVLLAYEKADPLVPVTDAVAFHAAYPDSTLVQFDPGTDAFHVHTMVSSTPLAAYHAFERDWVDAAMRRWSEARQAPAPVAAPAAPPAAAVPAPPVAAPQPAPAEQQPTNAKHRTGTKHRTKRRTKHRTKRH